MSTYRKWIFIFAILMLLAKTATADVSVNILKGKALGEKNAALFVAVVDEAGRPIKGLAKEDFKLLIGGEEISNFTVEPVSTTQEPLSIVLGIDISGSMKGRPFNETKRAISIFLDQLDKGDFISLMRFGTGVRFLTDFTNEKHKVREQVEPLAAVDMETHLYDATYEALEKGKREAPTTRTAVVLLTDGVDEGKRRGAVGSRRTRKEAVDMATGASIPIFTMGFGHRIDRAYLEEIARVSGGYFLFTPRPEEIAGVYRKVLDQLKNQYIIKFDFAKEPGDYKANLTLTYEGRTAKDSKKFLFNPALDVDRKIPRQYLLGSGAFLLVIVLLGFIYLKHRSRNGSPQDECQLEFPKETSTVPGSKTKLATGAQGAFLKVDCLKGKTIPLVYQDRELITELIIARRDKDSDRFKKQEAAYLWTPNRNTYVSRPNKSRNGHARVFLNKETERFVVEDIGSINGTLVNGKLLKEPLLLQDEDVIDVGGKQGIRLVYRESELSDIEKRDIEGTTIGKL